MEPKNIRVFVLDEADEMLSMGFEKELNAIVERLPATRQTMLFSATLSNEVGRLARSMKDPETILLSGDQVGALELTHYFYMQQGDKTRDLLRVIEVEDPQSAILFCNTKDETERVAKELRRAGYAADYLSGDLDQKDREKVMAATRESKLRFLVATDVAARGIDISHLTHVINVDFPDSAEQYVHRTGRTGRAGRTGTAVSLINAKDVGNLYYLRLTYGLRPIERTLPTEQELQTRRESDLVEKIATKVRERNVDAEAKAVARRLLTRDDAESLVAVLLRESLGSPVVAADEAARARRAKNPPPVVEAPPTTRAEPHARSLRERAARNAAEIPVRNAAPLPQTPPPAPIDSAVDSEAITARRRDRDRGRDKDRDRAGRAPHSKLAEWSPPEEADDETPLLSRGERGERAERPMLPEVKTVFVNSGRRDGLRASDVIKILEERGQIAADAIGRVRVRDRNSFIDVRPDVIDKAIEAIKGATVGTRTLNAELARPKGEEPGETFDDRTTLPMGSRR
jgi:ATP-dependent RNA helicase DeaD